MELPSVEVEKPVGRAGFLTIQSAALVPGKEVEGEDVGGSPSK